METVEANIFLTTTFILGWSGCLESEYDHICEQSKDVSIIGVILSEPSDQNIPLLTTPCLKGKIQQYQILLFGLLIYNIRMLIHKCFILKAYYGRLVKHNEIELNFLMVQL